MIDDPSLSEAEKRQFVEALWQIMVAFVDLGFGVHPVQQACGQLGDGAADSAANDKDVLCSEHHAKQRFEDAVLGAARDESDERSH